MTMQTLASTTALQATPVRFGAVGAQTWADRLDLGAFDISSSAFAISSSASASGVVSGVANGVASGVVSGGAVANSSSALLGLYDAVPMDLVATRLAVRSDASPGSSITLDGQLLNSSALATTTPVQVGFYLGRGPVTASSRLLGTQTLSPLAAQTSRAISQTFILPAATDLIWQGDGTYTIGMIVDPANAIHEVNEQNNLITTGLAVTVPKIYRYDFTYFYSGSVSDSAADSVTGNGSILGAGTGPNSATDYYTGFVYGNANRYQANTYVDYSVNPNEAQTNGRYWISQVTQAGTAADVGRVTVTQYYDGETNSLVGPASGSGSQDLGSEVGYLGAVPRNEERFGNDYYAADRLLTRPLDPQVAIGKSARVATIDALLNHDINGSVSYWNTSTNGGVITYSFYQPTSGPYAGRETVSPLSEAIKVNVRNLLADLETSINVRFVEVADTATNPGVLRYQFSTGSGPGFYAYTYYPGLGIGGDVHLSSTYASDFAKGPGSYGYKSLLHETLHGLGLKHPGNYNAGGGGSQGPYLLGGVDNSTNTIMTYNLAGSYAVTPMDDDLQALQYLYGARVEPANNTYRFTNLGQYSIDGRSIVSRGSNLVKQTLWDGGGDQDTLDFSALTGSYRFDLNPGGILTSQLAYNSVSYDDAAGGGRYQTSEYGTVIATGTLIENIINSRGNDQIMLNSASNTVLGYSLTTVTGNDVIEGASSQDTVVLAGYRLGDLTAMLDGSNLRLQLGQNGSILFKNYVASGVRVLLDGALYVYAPNVYAPTPNSVLSLATMPTNAGSWLTVAGGAAVTQVATRILTPLAARTVAATQIATAQTGAQSSSQSFSQFPVQVPATDSAGVPMAGGRSETLSAARPAVIALTNLGLTAQRHPILPPQARAADRPACNCPACSTPLSTLLPTAMADA